MRRLASVLRTSIAIGRYAATRISRMKTRIGALESHASAAPIRGCLFASFASIRLERRLGLLAATCLMMLALPAALSAQDVIAVQAGTSITPDTVRIGDPFLVRIRIRAPQGATISFPEPPDSSGTVQGLDPVHLTTDTTNARSTDQTATYRVAAWDVGDQPVKLGDVTVQLGGATRSVPLGGLTVFVKSVLPADSALRVPKPQRAIFEFRRFPWWIWAAIAAAVALLLGIWWWWRRRKRRPQLVRIEDPFERAEKDFLRLEALGLVEAHERGRFVALAVEILRDYLAARYAQAGLALTSTELLEEVRGIGPIPRDRLAKVLDEADLVKFARREVSAEQARGIAREARAIVAHEHALSQPAPATEAAA